MRLRRFLMLFAMVCFVGLYSIAEYHHHADEAGEMACAVCHVAAHSSADIPVPDLSAPAFVLVLLFLLGLAGSLPVPGRASFRPRSRSPPACS